MNKKVILINIAVLLILLIISDLGIGLLYNRLAPASGKLNIDIMLGRISTDKLLNERPHPYMLWENTPEFISKGIRQINKQGYRNEKDTGALEPGTLRILALGGSATWGYLLDGPGDAWPAQLENKLNENIGGTKYKKVEVINAGLNYATSAELLSHYIYRDRYLGSKIVIMNTGDNDIAPLLFHDYDPEYTHFRPGWNGRTDSLGRTERWLVEHSNIIKLIYAFRRRNSITLPQINKQAESFDLPEEYYLENVKKNQPIGLERNLDLLIRNILADGSLPVLFAPIFASDKQYNGLSGEAATRAALIRNVRKAAVIGMAKDLEVIKQLSAKYQIPLIEIPSDRIPLEYFLDHNHLSKEAATIEGQIVAEHILKLLQTGQTSTTNPRLVSGL